MLGGGTDCRPELRWRYTMSRLAGFYIAKAMESAAGGSTAAAVSGVPPRRAGDHVALDAIRANHRSPSILQRVVAAVHLISGLLRIGPGRRRLDHLGVLPRDSAQQPSAR